MAVIVAVLAVATAAAVAVKTAVELPAAMFTEAGVVTELLLSESATRTPPKGAAPLSVNVHVEVAAPVTVAGLQLNLDKATGGAGTITTPPDAVVVSDIPLIEAADAFVTKMGRLRPIPAKRVKLPEIMTPFGMVVALNPLNRQV